MSSRPTVSIQTPSNKEAKATTPLPAVFVAPIRDDIVQYVHTLMNKNHRQPYAVKHMAGMKYAAESWGTGRAVARIPRVPGSGTHRSGQAAFGNMCRGGRMFAPTKIWRRWHRKISVGQRRYATCSALAATAVPALVMSRGHRISHIAEIPFVIADKEFETITKTKVAAKFLKTIHADEDVERVKDSRGLRAGQGKSRNRRYVQRKGPLIIHNKPGRNSIELAFRNIPGIELCNVHRLNLLQLAPGGHLGRFVIWTESAFKELNKVFGTYRVDSTEKSGYRPPLNILTNAGIGGIINSTAIQSVLRPAKPQQKYHTRHKNALKNFGAMVKLNPYKLTERRKALLKAASKQAKKKSVVAKNKRDMYKAITFHNPPAPARHPAEGKAVY